jgi:hypothetical protein
MATADIQQRTGHPPHQLLSFSNGIHAKPVEMQAGLVTLRRGLSAIKHRLAYRARRTRRSLHLVFVRGLVLWLKFRHATCRRSLLSADGKAVVCLTSHGDRLESVFLAIESIGRGRQRPARLILWLEETEFTAASPTTLRNLVRRGLEIRECGRYGPHSKYFPYVISSRDDRLPLVTADDDILYPRYWLAELVAKWQLHPTEVHCFRARVMKLMDDGIAPWTSFPKCRSVQASQFNIATGVSGIIYPSSMLDAALSLGGQFMNCTPHNDDIWLHAVALRTGTLVRQVRPRPKDFFIIPGSQAIRLGQENKRGRNDRQVIATYDNHDLQLLQEALLREGATAAVTG